MENTMKKYRILLFSIIEIFFLILTMKQSFVTGVAGSEDGAFAVGFSLQNGMNRHDLLFYDSDGKFVRKVTITYRGHITLGSFDNYLIVQKTSSKSFYDFRGFSVDNVAYSGGDIYKKKKDLISDNYTLKYDRDFWGTEHIYYTSGNDTEEIDLNYNYYRIQKLLKFIFVSMILLMFFYKPEIWKKQDTQVK